MSSLHKLRTTILVSGILAVMIIVAGGLALAHMSSSVVSAQQGPFSITVRAMTRSVNSGTRTNLEVSCSTSEVATGGGGSIGVSPSTKGASLARSAPLPYNTNGGTNPTGWRITAANESGQVQSATVWVLCASTTETPPTETPTETSTTGSSKR